jgi:O-antigen/teichoic acid export membrane protein
MTAATMATSFVVQVALARVLGPIGLGEYAATGLFFVALTTLAMFGVPSALSERVARSDDLDRAHQHLGSVALGLSFIAGALVALIALVAWPWFSRAVGLTAPASLPLVVAAIFLAVVLHLMGSVLVARLDMRAATLIFVSQPFTVGAGLLSGDLVRLDGSTLAALGFLGAGIVAGAVATKEGVRPIFIKDELRLLLSRSVGGSIVPYAAFVSAWVDRAVVVAIAGMGGLGWFTAASYMAESVLRLPRTLGAFGIPAYARLGEDRVAASRVLDSHLRILFTFLLVSSAFLVATGGGLLTFLFRDDFVLGATALRLLAMALVPTGVALTLAGNVIGRGDFGRATRVLLVFVPLQLLASITATGLFSVAGTAFASFLVWTTIASILAHVAGIRFRTAAEMLGASVPVWAIAWILATRGLPWPIVGVLSSGVALIACITFLIRRPEIRVLQHLTGRAPATIGL